MFGIFLTVSIIFDAMASFHEEGECSVFLNVNYVAIKEGKTSDIVDDAPHAEQQATKVKLISKETYNKTIRNQFKWWDSPNYDLDIWLEHQGQKLLVDPDNNKQLELSVVELVSSLSHDMCEEEYIPDSSEIKFDVKVLGIGSYYSCTKKHPADEFDFLFESKLRTNQLRFVHQPLPNTETTDFSRPDFFRIYNENNQELKAEEWRKAFQSGLTNALKSRYPDCAIEYNGPALSFIVESVALNKHLKSPVKVDMTFGIPLDAEEPDHIWPLQSTRVTLDTNSDTRTTLTPLPGLGRIARCHFVPFGDLWRVSFARHEGGLIRNFSKEKRRLLVVIKVIRNCRRCLKEYKVRFPASFHSLCRQLNNA